MIITYLGKQFFKVQQGEMVFAFNPISKKSKLDSSSRFGAEIAFISVNHPDFNGVEQLSHGDKTPFVIDSPGEYEIKDIFIKSIQSFTRISGEQKINSTFILTIDGITMLFLGAFSEKDLSKEIRESIEGVDVLFLPCGGGDVLDAKNAAKIAAVLEAKIIIPMDYDKESLKVFLKEVGTENPEIVDKLTLKRKDLEGKENYVIVLKN